MEIAFDMAVFSMVLAGSIFWIAMLMDCARNEPDSGSDKGRVDLDYSFHPHTGSSDLQLRRRRSRRFAAYHAQLPPLANG
jgi:hypothetical protein